MPMNSSVREFRALKLTGLRADKSDDGKRYLSGYAATYNTVSEDLGWGMRERILPGAFKRAIAEKQDVRHLINHDPSLVLGRTKSGTTELSEDSKGLKFRTLVNEADPSATALVAKVERGDVDECSFGFIAVRTSWIEEPDPENPDYPRQVRQLEDVDLFDVSTVTYPAYPGTNTKAERSLFPDGVPAEIRSRFPVTRDAQDGDPCACTCAECEAGDCEDCTNADCEDENCRCMDSERSKKKARTKRVDGENLTSDRFLIVGDEEDTRTWKLPWKFSTEEKTRSHTQNALVRFNQLSGVPDEARKTAWGKLVKLCKEHDIDVSGESSVRSHLTPDQIYDFEQDAARIRAYARAVAVQASL